MPVSSYIDSLPYIPRANNPHNFSQLAACLLAITRRLTDAIPYSNNSNDLNKLFFGDMRIYSWLSNSNFPYKTETYSQGKDLQRHIIYQFLRVLLLDLYIPNNVPDYHEMHALLLKSDRKDDYVNAGRTILFHPQDGIKTSVLGNMDRNPDIESPLNLITTLQTCCLQFLLIIRKILVTIHLRN